MRSPRLLVTVLSAAFVQAGPLWLRAQSVDQLAAAYSGTLMWNQASATLVSLREDTMTLRGSITNAHVRLKGYAGEFQKGKNLLIVCGSTEKRTSYDCLPPDRPLRATPQSNESKTP
jgi:hypothetical protein